MLLEDCNFMMNMANGTGTITITIMIILEFCSKELLYTSIIT